MVMRKQNALNGECLCLKQDSCQWPEIILTAVLSPSAGKLNVLAAVLIPPIQSLICQD
jgi:hypothetical protein